MAGPSRKNNSTSGFSEAPPDRPRTSPPHYHGHRQRLYERFRHHGANALPDYELLELVLFRALPRRDTKPLAKMLIDHFGGFGACLGADPERLKELPGIGEKVVTELKLVEAAAIRLLQGQLREKPLLGSWSAVIDYCRAAMAQSSKEQFRVLFLNKKNHLISDEVQQQGTVDHTPVYPREVIKRALELSATAIILVHNHPSGDPSPSQADIDMTARIVDAARNLGIIVHDHIIIGRRGETSFKSLGLM